MTETLKKWRDLAEESIADAGEWKGRFLALERDMKGTVATMDRERTAARTMLAALREITQDAPADDPGEGDWSDGLDSAFACGLEAAHYEAARIARTAIAAAEAAGITA